MSVANPSSLTIPSTQNTAPIHCFRCLYTYDLRRKAKRWQDGAVRFHTFNKRIMVYDISRNFIGDTHWRDGGVIEDGDELELDKGVLIQVGEKTESVDQDLTSLLERRGKNHTKPAENHGASSAVSNLPSMEHPGLSPPSQLRPKSLNAILGTPSGPLGRAAQQLKSPCELRLQKEHDLDMQRSAKRRRIECASKAGLPSITTQDPTTTSRTSNSKGDTDSGMAQAANGDNLLRQSSPSTARTKRLQTAAATAAPTAPQTSAGRITEEHVSDETLRQVRRPKSTRLPNSRVHEKTSSCNMTNGIEIPMDAQEDEPPPMRQLQIMSRKPRKKLIYQDVLPSIAHTDRGPQGPRQLNIDDTSLRKRREKADPQVEFHRAQRERIESRLVKQSRREKNTSREEDILPSITIPDDEAHIPLPALNRDTSTENHGGNLQTDFSLPRGSEVQPNNLPRRNKEKLPSPTAISKQTTTAAAFPSDHDLAQMDQILLTRPSSKPISSPQIPHLQPLKPPANQPAVASPAPSTSTSASASASKPPNNPPSVTAAAPPPPLPSTTTADIPPRIPTKHQPPNLNLNPNPPTSHKPLPPTLHPLPPPPPPPPPPPQPLLSLSKPPHHHKRSPMRKTVSEPLDRLYSMPQTNSNSSSNSNLYSNPDGNSVDVAVAADQVPDPWSREAWDLFGCERPVRRKGGREEEDRGRGMDGGTGGRGDGGGWEMREVVNT